MGANKGGNVGVFKQDYKLPKYREYYPDVVEGMLREGKSKQDILYYLNIDEYALTVWRFKYPKLNEAWIRGSSPIDYQVESSLLKRAMGFKQTEITYKEVLYKDEIKVLKSTVVKEIAPDVSACIIWMTNRRPDKWKLKNKEEVVEEKLITLLNKLENLNPKKKNLILEADESSEVINLAQANTEGISSLNNDMNGNANNNANSNNTNDEDSYEKILEENPHLKETFKDEKEFINFINFYNGISDENEEKNFNADDNAEKFDSIEENSTMENEFEAKQNVNLDPEAYPLDGDDLEEYEKTADKQYRIGNEDEESEGL